MVDYWSTQTGRIHDILTIPCLTGDAVLEGSSVKFGTTAADSIVVLPSAATGDGVAVAMKAASASGEVIPVVFHGVFKMTTTSISHIPGAGDICINSITTTVCATTGSPANALGMALQTSTAVGDKILVLIGRTD
jgi:predicted RecA/RadA family phage recombinase